MSNFESKNLLSAAGVFFYGLAAYSAYTIYKIMGSINYLVDQYAAVSPIIFTWFGLATLSAMLLTLAKTGKIDNLSMHVTISIFLLVNIVFGVTNSLSAMITGDFERTIIALIVAITPHLPISYQNFMGWREILRKPGN